MTFQKKVYVLSSLLGVLVLVYILTFFLDATKIEETQSRFSLVDPKVLTSLTKIQITRAADSPITLIKRGQDWFVQVSEQDEFPVKKGKIEDFFSFFSKKAFYPVRARTKEAHEKLGLTSEKAKKVLLASEKGPLAEFLFGDRDVSGQEVYFRIGEKEEVRSGSDTILSYIEGGLPSWYDLRFFPQEGKYALTSDLIQRVRIEEKGKAPLTLSRKENNEWDCQEGTSRFGADPQKVAQYLQTVISTEGETFITAAEKIAKQGVEKASITLELGDGRTKRIVIYKTSDEKFTGTSSDTAYVYSLALWSVERLLKKSDDFKKNESQPTP
ncbi:MAG: DUF4340 domain-containing protein [Treponemataceae bacterium]|nr:DUF4340 domain-containing protein [Treponemataceae bacterium]